MTEKELYFEAVDAMKNSYSPYSNFKVGSALLLENGKVYKGCNIENSSYGATICAERTALVKAISEGEKKISAIAIAGSNGELTYPCGICRQFIYEFGSEIKIILGNDKGEIVVKSINELLPEGFILTRNVEDENGI